MAQEVASPACLEAFAENQLAVLIRAQLTAPDSMVLTGNGTRELIEEGEPSVVVTVVRQEEDPPDTGWWMCDIEVCLDPAGADGDWVDARMLEIEAALGNGDNDLKASLTTGRLYCMTGSVRTDAPLETEDEDGLRWFKLSAYLGLSAS